MSQTEPATLRSLRLARGMTMGALARAVPMDGSVLSRLERGMLASMNNLYVEAMARELRYPVETILAAFTTTRSLYLAAHPEVPRTRYGKTPPTPASA